MPEPVGTKLAELIAECGIEVPDCLSCKSMMEKMDGWGVFYCGKHRTEIIHHLAEASDGKWLDMAKAVLKGYFSLGSMLDEAIRRSRIPRV